MMSSPSQIRASCTSRSATRTITAQTTRTPEDEFLRATVAGEEPAEQDARHPYAPIMLIVVSGTHASGKSTLIGDFSAAHPAYEVLPDPYELIDEAGDEPDAALFLAQLGISGRRLLEFERGARVIAERGPLDFLAYLTALDELGRASRPGGHPSRALDLAVAAMAHVDLLVIL